MHDVAPIVSDQSVLADFDHRNKKKQDWPVASELVSGGMYFPFCLQRARYDHPIRQKVPLENQWKKTSSSAWGFEITELQSSNTIKQLEVGLTSK